MQRKHQLNALRASDDDLILLRATCEGDHRFDDLLIR